MWRHSHLLTKFSEDAPPPAHLCINWLNLGQPGFGLTDCVSGAEPRPAALAADTYLRFLWQPWKEDLVEQRSLWVSVVGISLQCL